jgi:hypothetical protein
MRKTRFTEEQIVAVVDEVEGQRHSVRFWHCRSHQTLTEKAGRIRLNTEILRTRLAGVYWLHSPTFQVRQ